jgi:hypothetical protein
VQLDTTKLQPSTTYYAQVTASNKWGSAASSLAPVTTGLPFVVASGSVNMLYSPTSGTLAVVGGANSAVSSDVSGTLSINNGTPINSAAGMGSQTSGTIDYFTTLMQKNISAIISVPGQGCAGATASAINQAMNSNTFLDNIYSYNLDPNDSTFNGLNTDSTTFVTGLSAAQMTDPSVNGSLANVLANVANGCSVYMGPGWGQLSSTAVATVMNHDICLTQADCSAAAGSFGLLWTSVPALQPGDSLSVSLSAGNANTGPCTTMLSPIVVPGTPPSSPTAVHLTP